ncbi:MAG: WecB/TagA/CpsF family glycosyltransferase, partial [Anaerolineales bacterium]
GLLFAAQLLGLKRYAPPLEEQENSEVGPGVSASSKLKAHVPQVDVFGVQISALTVADLHQIIAAAVDTNTRALLPNVNAHALNLAYETPWLRDFFNQSTAVFPDGSGALFAARVQGGHFEERVTYADWMWDLARFCAERGFSLYFRGGREGVAEEAANTLRARFTDLHVAGTHEGYFDKSSQSPENTAVMAEINRLQPDILIVGFGMPRQERWLMENWDRLEVHVGLTGGAVFDYISGRLRRPPRVLSEHGLEWLGRLLIEPHRLWRRYLLGLPQFGWRVIRHRLWR